MAPSAVVETWSLYAVGSLIIFSRIFVRWRMIGLRGFKPDDYIILLSWVTYTVMTVAAHIVGGLGDLHALTLEQRKALTDEEAAPYIYGTQWFCAGVATYVLFIWTLKFNMLFLYQRVVRGLWVEKFIKPVMLLLGATFIAIFLILFCACRPYNRMWVVYPDQGSICKPQSFLNMVPALIMNIITDICIMAIPTPVVLPLQTTLWKRVGLLFLFSAGLFIMIAAILRVTMVLVEKNGATAAIWSCREDFVAIVVGQAILVRPMFSAKFWSRDYGSHNKGYKSSGPSKNSANLGASFDMGGAKRSKNKDPFSVTVALATVNGDNDSTEEIMNHPSGSHSGAVTSTRTDSPGSSRDLERGVSKHSRNMVIHVNKQIYVETAERSGMPKRGVEKWEDSYERI
ncbi:hypothetical protein BGZ61DRAFT_499856 [Ilyonectria robusta]|uniref:uncharacterized protein n=1 Tax=Ilyonectria robusta TaxID=1079257 RepID=UPI001E8E0402|nr:uncharacterized protein BGZ61DRAFT_499856 [Ilyonectria robusta]KAH6974361.1 hypothetical protein BKA56DRAFT_675802 [Ilyonectria sp. MPI-CAGE-AT-0026]KAH8658979.1 hypothetical protein BGZ61DRAFT_499856 [Ilyonectria robusta]